jgi:hypothetical protein
MKTVINTMMIGIAACAFAAPAFAYTLNGTIPATKPPKWVAIHLQKPPSSSGYLKLTLSSPPVSAGVPYSVNLCFGPASTPVSCGSNAGFLVLPGQQSIVFVAASIYPNDVIWVQQGTTVAVPYSVDVDYIP